MTESRYPNDIVRPSDVQPEYANLLPERLLAEIDVKPETLISIQNVNNLSEVLIYRRTDYSYKDNRILRWDGKTVDLKWYKENESVLTISNAEQLIGLATMVNDGNDFKGKTIKLDANINLNEHEWTPIGRGIDMRSHTSTGYPKLTPTAIEHPFSGTFDGDHHTIYGLKMSHTLEDVYCMGLFGSCVDATLRNINFANVHLGSMESVGSFAALVGCAKNTTCANIIVSGYICGTRVSAICGVAIDTTFHNCINRATLSCVSPTDNHTLSIGGIVQQISLSEESLIKIPDKDYALLFNRCIQNGHMNADVKNAKYFWTGQIYGSLESDVRTTNFVIDRCQIGDPIQFINLNTMYTKSNVVGIPEDINTDRQLTSISASNHHKHELLNGLVGKTDSDVGIKIYNVTNSVRINSLPIPGSVNVMQSKPLDKFFTTIDVLPLEKEDGILNLLPYYEYVKTATI